MPLTGLIKIVNTGIVTECSMNLSGHHLSVCNPFASLMFACSRWSVGGFRLNLTVRPRGAGFGWLACLLVVELASLGALGAEKTEMAGGKASATISYYREIRPILQANCQGCHQPAKAKGGYVMTSFKGLLAGGETEGVSIVPEHPDKSAILKMVTPENGEARMPKGKSPLAESEVALITTWIQQGAQDDTPPDAKQHYDTEHPPLYAHPPVVPAVDFSPDGQLLAVAR